MDMAADFGRPRIPSDILSAATDSATAAASQQLRTPRLPQDNAGTYEPGAKGQGRLDAWWIALQQLLRADGPRSMPRILLDSSHQGSGKSYAVPDLAIEWVFQDTRITYRQIDKQWDNQVGDFIDGTDPKPLAPSGFIYVSRNFRSPSIPTIEQKFQEIPTRHQGLIHAPGPEGGFIRRTITAAELKDGIAPDEPATCVFAHRLHNLASRGFAYKDATESFCKDRCPHRPQRFDQKSGKPTGGDGTCIHRINTTGFWEGHEGADEPAPASPTIRCSVQALEGLIQLCPNFLAHSLVFFDESDQLLEAAIKTHNLSKRKLGDLLAFLPAQFMHRPWFPANFGPHCFETDEADEKAALATAQRLTEQLLTQLLQLLTQIKNPHGIDHHQVRRHLSSWIEEVLATYGHGDGIQLPTQWQLNSDAHLTRPDDFERAITATDDDPLDNLPSPLLPTLVHCILGTDAGQQFSNFSLSVTKQRSGSDGAKPSNYRITLTSPSGLLQAIAEASAAVLVGDATADPDLIRQMFAKAGEPIAFKHLKAAPVRKVEQADVQFFQIKDLGAMTAQRSGDQIKRLEAIRSSIRWWAIRTLTGRDALANDDAQRAADLKIGFIDHKACAKPADGKWFTATARGGNQFQDFDVLVLVGKPIKNVSAALSEYVALTGDTAAATGCSPEENSPGFIRYQAHLVAAEAQQAWERLRIIRRPGKRLLVVFASDINLSGMPIDVVQIQAGDITPNAARKTEQKLHAITQAIHDLAAQGLPPDRISTQRVAALSGVSKTSIQRIASHQSDGKPWFAFVLTTLGLHAAP
jgi:hypothetical protein